MSIVVDIWLIVNSPEGDILIVNTACCCFSLRIAITTGKVFFANIHGTEESTHFGRTQIQQI
jgi:hypothetical protein